jgi:hypothetical protein
VVGFNTKAEIDHVSRLVGCVNELGRRALRRKRPGAEKRNEAEKKDSGSRGREHESKRTFGEQGSQGRGVHVWHSSRLQQGAIAYAMANERALRRRIVAAGYRSRQFPNWEWVS